MDTGSPIGDAILAGNITNAYAQDAEGLTKDECISRGLNDEQAVALVSALGKGSEGIVTQAERGRLADAGFAAEFVEALAGPDGNRALQKRAKWLGDHFISSLFHQDLPREKKIDFIAELGEMGPVTPDTVNALKAAMLFQKGDLQTLARRELVRMGLAAVPALVELLHDAMNRDDSDMEELAAAALGEIGPPAGDAACFLKYLLGKGSDRVRVAAAVAMDRIGPVEGPDISKLSAMLEDKDPSIRRYALMLIGYMNIDAAAVMPLLIRALDDESADIRAHAIGAVGTLGEASPAVIAAVRKKLDDEVEAVRDAAAALLKDFESHLRMVDFLSDRENDGEARSREAHAIGLLNVRTSQAIAALGAALEDDDTREMAGWSLETIGAAAVPALIQALGDDQWRVRERAARALGGIGPDASAAVLALRISLRDGDKDVRAQAARALGRIGSAEAETVTALVKALDDCREVVRTEAARALGAFGPAAKAAVPGLVRALGDSEDVRIQAANALGRIGVAAVPELVRALDDDDDDVRRGAAFALGEIGPDSKAAVSALVRAVGDEEEEVRDAAVRALGWIGPEAGAAAPALLRLLKNGEPEERLNAAAALAMMGMELDAAYAELIKALKTYDNDEQMKASEAICVCFTRMDEATKARYLRQLEERHAKDGRILYRALIETLGDSKFGLLNKTISSWGDSRVRQFGGERALSFVYSPEGDILAEIPGRLREMEDGEVVVLDLMGRIKIKLEEPSMEVVSSILALIKMLPADFLTDVGFQGMAADENRLAGGSYEKSGQSVSYRYLTWNVIVHELAHHWGMTIAPEKSAVFDRISWVGVDPERYLYGSVYFAIVPGRLDFDRNDFVREYSLYNPHEDFATTVEEYVCDGPWFRKWVRREMVDGNFEPAAKYLFVKHVMPFQGKEYDLDNDLLGIEEVKKMYHKLKDKSKTCKGTYDIILEIEKQIPKK